MHFLTFERTFPIRRLISNLNLVKQPIHWKLGNFLCHNLWCLVMLQSALILLPFGFLMRRKYLVSLQQVSLLTFSVRTSNLSRNIEKVLYICMNLWHFAQMWFPSKSFSKNHANEILNMCWHFNISRLPLLQMNDWTGGCKSLDSF